MNQLTYTHDGILLDWTAAPFSYFAVMGRTSESFFSPSEEKTKEYHRGPCIFEGSHFFQEIHSFLPPYNLTISTLTDGEFCLVVEGLGREKTKDILLEQLTLKQFIAIPPTQALIQEMQRSVNVLIEMWRLCENTKDIPLEKIYGAVRYGNFLQYSKICSEEESLIRAARKYHISGF